jgi:hypothetical protein
MGKRHHEKESKVDVTFYAWLKGRMLVPINRNRIVRITAIGIT